MKDSSGSSSSQMITFSPNNGTSPLFIKNLLLDSGESDVLTSLIPRDSSLFAQQDCQCWHFIEPKEDLQDTSVALHLFASFLLKKKKKKVKMKSGKLFIELSFVVLAKKKNEMKLKLKNGILFLSIAQPAIQHHFRREHSWKSPTRPTPNEGLTSGK